MVQITNFMRAYYGLASCIIAAIILPIYVLWLTSSQEKLQDMHLGFLPGKVWAIIIPAVLFALFVLTVCVILPIMGEWPQKGEGCKKYHDDAYFREHADACLQDFSDSGDGFHASIQYERAYYAQELKPKKQMVKRFMKKASKIHRKYM